MAECFKIFENLEEEKPVFFLSVKIVHTLVKHFDKLMSKAEGVIVHMKTYYTETKKFCCYSILTLFYRQQAEVR
jgi:hypothetical protein